MTNGFKNLILLAAAGFCGAVARCILQCLPLPWLGGFPLATLLVNALGSFLIFLVFDYGTRKGCLSTRAVKIINTGFLGAFTTMSAVGADAITLMTSGNAFMACVYVIATFALTFAAALVAALICRVGDAR